MPAVTAKNLKLFNLRKIRGWTQIEVAAKCGITIGTYQAIEQGKSEGKPRVWIRLQKLYSIPDEEMWKIIKMSM